MMNNKEPWERELQESLDRMESWVGNTTSDLPMWEQMITEERRSERNRLRRELSYFLTTALVLILGLISFTQLPIVFVGVQVGVLLGFPLYGAFKLLKKVTTR
jgi:hypothetical protein